MFLNLFVSPPLKKFGWMPVGDAEIDNYRHLRNNYVFNVYTSNFSLAKGNVSNGERPYRSRPTPKYQNRLVYSI